VPPPVIDDCYIDDGRCEGGGVNAEPVFEIWPSVVERLVRWSLYYWAVVLAGFVLLIPEALILLAIRGEIAGPLGPVGEVLLAVGWVLLAIPFVRWVHRFNTRFVDRSTLRLTPHTLSLGRHGRTEIDLDNVHEVYFVVRRLIRRPRYISADRRRFHLMLLVLVDGSLVPVSTSNAASVDHPPSPTVDAFTRALIAALGPKLRDREPLPAQAEHYLGRGNRNRRHPAPHTPIRRW
jgi:hypothetical protein